MKRIVVLLLHVGYWMMYLLLLAVLFGMLAGEMHGRDPEASLSDAFRSWIRLMCPFAIIPGVIGFYTYHSLLFRHFLQTKKFGLLFAGMLASGLVAVGCGLLALRWIPEAEASNVWHEGSALLFISIFLFFIATVNGILGLVMNGFVQWYGDIRLKAELRQKNFETELALIKAQLNPHFLFNTINNIDVLILRDPAQASLYLNKLSDILRFLLYESQNEKVELSKELQYIEKYIELQRIRTSNPGFVKFVVNGNPEGHSVAAMLFIPFIENAFKYAENKKADDAISVSIGIEENRIRFECRNVVSAHAQSAPETGGLGNALIKKRLELLYPDRHTLAAGKNGNTYLVQLELST
jgi:hypothetical protein